MSRPPVNPEKSLAGIAVDPISLERVIPESRRPDGTVRKQLKVRPGFTPQEDIRRFRGTKQAQMDANALPNGHIIGWAPPPGATNTTKPGGNNSNAAVSSSSTTSMTKAAKKNAKRKEKREREKAEKENEQVPDNWEDDEQVEPKTTSASAEKEVPNQQSVEDTLSSQLEKLDVNQDVTEAD